MEETGEGAGGAMQVQEQEMEMEQAQDQREMLKVMVAIDESEESLHALEWALDNTLRRVGIVPESSEEAGSVYVAHVQPPGMHYLFPAGSAAVTASLERAQQEISGAILSRALSICKQKMIKAETMILNGDPKEMICEMVESIGINLLVIGSRSRSALKRVVLGSVSDYCAQHAKCPVLIVKPPREIN